LIIGEFPSDSGAFQCSVTALSVTSITSGVPGSDGTSVMSVTYNIKLTFSYFTFDNMNDAVSVQAIFSS
jgi:hypothetical protein